MVLSRSLKKFQQLEPAVNKALNLIATSVNKNHFYYLFISPLALQLGNDTDFELRYDKMMSYGVVIMAYGLQVLSNRNYFEATKAATHLA